MSKPRKDGSYTLITPNKLLLCRSMNVLPDDVQLADELPVASKYRIVQHVTTSFWNRLSSELSPGLVHRQKWHQKGRNLQIKDVVKICGEDESKRQVPSCYCGRCEGEQRRKCAVCYRSLQLYQNFTSR